jgi:hypothetical protein
LHELIARLDDDSRAYAGSVLAFVTGAGGVTKNAARWEKVGALQYGINKGVGHEDHPTVAREET